MTMRMNHHLLTVAMGITTIAVVTRTISIAANMDFIINVKL
jgi:hypothetical protein